jgi:hypothetical protein
MIIENISRVILVMGWSSILLKATIFLQKQIVDGRYNVFLQHRSVGSICDICLKEKWPYQSSGKQITPH